jgi:hypothetical protein
MKGHCACGAAQYEMGAAPLIVHCCHCRWCQRESGSAFALNAFIETKHVQLTAGTVEVVDIPSESGAGQRVHRCADCKVALWANYLGLGTDFSFVKVGTLDEPDKCPPDVHIFTESKQPWVVLDKELPVYEEYYRRSEAWSEGSMKRFHALMDARD